MNRWRVAGTRLRSPGLGVPNTSDLLGLIPADVGSRPDAHDEIHDGAWVLRARGLRPCSAQRQLSD